MLNPYTLNLQESFKHAWHRGIEFLRCLAAKVLRNKAFHRGRVVERMKCMVMLQYSICDMHFGIDFGDFW